MHRLPLNPVKDVEKPPQPRGGDITSSRPRRYAPSSAPPPREQDAALFLTAAFTGLRMGELIALRWRDVDLPAPRSACAPPTPPARSPRPSPARSAPSRWRPSRRSARGPRPAAPAGADDLVFLGDTGGYLDGSALRRRYKAALARAGLRPLRFHDLRHTFGTRVIAKADIRRVQEWMGHADIQTTMRYLHYAPRPEDARLVGRAFDSESNARALDSGIAADERAQTAPLLDPRHMQAALIGERRSAPRSGLPHKRPHERSKRTSPTHPVASGPIGVGYPPRWLGKRTSRRRWATCATRRARRGVRWRPARGRSHRPARCRQVPSSA